MTVNKNWIVVFICLLFLSCSDIQDTFYKTMGDVQISGAIEKGWIPKILPKSSYEIYERHDLDTNSVWLRFKFDNRDIKELIAQIKEVQPNEVDTIKFIVPNVSWWPKNINRESIKNKQSDLKLYQYERIIEYSDRRQKIVPSFFIIDWNSNTGYYWQYPI